MKIISIFLFMAMILVNGCSTPNESPSRNTYLQALGESSWPPEEKSLNEAYRFTCYPSFRGPVAIIIIVNPDSTGTMTIKVAEGACGQGRVGEIAHLSETHLSTNQVEQLRIEKSKIVVKPTQDFIPDVFQGADGAGWHIETLMSGYYESLERWSPSYNEDVEHEFLSEEAVPLAEHGGLFDDDRPLLFDNRTQDDIRSYIATNESFVDFVELLLSWSSLPAEQQDIISNY